MTRSRIGAKSKWYWVGSGLAGAIFLTVAVAIWFQPSPTIPKDMRLATALPFALRLINDQGYVPVTVEKGYQVGDTFVLPGAMLYYSSTTCFGSGLVERSGKTTFPNIVVDNAAELGATLAFLKLSD